MNFPDAPAAREGFFVTHFFTLRNQEKSKDFYIRDYPLDCAVPLPVI